MLILIFHQIAKLPLQVTLPEIICIKGALSGLRQFLATEIPLKILEKCFFISP